MTETHNLMASAGCVPISLIRREIKEGHRQSAAGCRAAGKALKISKRAPGSPHEAAWIRRAKDFDKDWRDDHLRAVMFEQELLIALSMGKPE